MSKAELMKKIRGNLTLRYIRRIYWSAWIELYSKKTDDLTFIQKSYEKATGRKIDFQNPVRYTEKLQWLKLFYRHPLMARCSDKEELKNYLSEIGYGDMAVKTIALYNDVNDIDISELPDKFVMKATHGSGWNLICTDKTKLDWKKWKRLFQIWQTQNPHWLGREWNYKDVKPRIVVEEYLEDDSGALRDYKVFCHNGKAQYMQIDENRYGDHKKRFINKAGELLNLELAGAGYGKELSLQISDLQKTMFEIAEKLSEPFQWVRVDFYEFNRKLYIGEFTFFSYGANFAFDPDEWDFIWGNDLQLPEPNHNLELYKKIQEQ